MHEKVRTCEFVMKTFETMRNTEFGFTTHEYLDVEKLRWLFLWAYQICYGHHELHSSTNLNINFYYYDCVDNECWLVWCFWHSTRACANYLPMFFSIYLTLIPLKILEYSKRRKWKCPPENENSLLFVLSSVCTITFQLVTEIDRFWYEIHCIKMVMITSPTWSRFNQKASTVTGFYGVWINIIAVTVLPEKKKWILTLHGHTYE